MAAALCDIMFSLPLQHDYASHVNIILPPYYFTATLPKIES